MNVEIAETDWREAGKADRRRRIVEAAARLVRENGFDAVSMTQIAKEANLSPATLYNLFKTKAAIYRQVFELDLEAFRQRLNESPSRDALDRIFVGVELAASLYDRDAAFYRAMARGAYGDGDDIAVVADPRRKLWQDEVAAAVAQGLLVRNAPSRLLGTAMTQLMVGVFLDWASHLLDARRAAQEASYGFGLLLLNYAETGAAGRLQARLRRLARELEKAL